MRRIVLATLLVTSFPIAAWAQSQVCVGVSCSGQGTCAELRGSPVCTCNDGFQRPSEGSLEYRLRSCVPAAVEDEGDATVSLVGRDDSRLWGFGSRLGAGYMGGGFPAAENVVVVGTGLKLDLASLDFRYFFRNGNSLDISFFPVATIIIAAAASAFYIDPFIYYSFNFGSGTTRATIGLGMRFILAAVSSDVIFGMQVPVNLGIEFLSSSRRFGFQIYARPYFHLQPDRENTAVGGGIMGGIAFFGYRTARP